jgi:hypothetical protein
MIPRVLRQRIRPTTLVSLPPDLTARPGSCNLMALTKVKDAFRHSQLTKDVVEDWSRKSQLRGGHASGPDNKAVRVLTGTSRWPRFERWSARRCGLWFVQVFLTALSLSCARGESENRSAGAAETSVYESSNKMESPLRAASLRNDAKTSPLCFGFWLDNLVDPAAANLCLLDGRVALKERLAAFPPAEADFGDNKRRLPHRVALEPQPGEPGVMSCGRGLGRDADRYIGKITCTSRGQRRIQLLDEEWVLTAEFEHEHLPPWQLSATLLRPDNMSCPEVFQKARSILQKLDESDTARRCAKLDGTCHRLSTIDTPNEGLCRAPRVRAGFVVMEKGKTQTQFALEYWQGRRPYSSQIGATGSDLCDLSRCELTLTLTR